MLAGNVISLARRCGLRKNKKEEIEKNFSREYSNSLEDYLKEELKKYKNVEVVIMNKPKERK